MWQGMVSIAEWLSVPAVAVLLSSLLAFLRTMCFRYPIRIVIYEVSACSLITCSLSIGGYFKIPPDIQILMNNRETQTEVGFYQLP